MTLNPQAPDSVVMIRSHHFFPNGMTAQDNTFQRALSDADREVAWKRAYDEVTQAAETLRQQGITVFLFEDETTKTPDSVFPNNWFSTHPDGRIVLYPMYAKNRRLERRKDVIDLLKDRFIVTDVVDYSSLESEEVFLEGTGAMVLDHIHHIAYMARSNRADPVAFLRWCNEFGFRPIMFGATDGQGVAVYHTNVLMCLGTKVALICLDMINTEDERKLVKEAIVSTDRTLIELTANQISQFAGNAIELSAKDGPVIALSQSARDALTGEQVREIECHARLLPIQVPTIECAGGSVRCMIAGVHLSSKPTATDVL